MVIKVGINGFGRIGRIVFRTCIQNSEIQLSAINDPAIDIEYICYLIKFDSTHGKFNGTIAYTNDGILINDRQIKVFREKLPSLIPWHTADVEYVVEASGMFTCLEKSSGHLQSPGVKRVIVTAPSVDVPMVVLGVNEHKVDVDQKILSSVSSTLYCLAPIVKILSDNFGVADGFITSIHAMTPSLKPLDGLCLKGKHWRDHRSIHQNIIPASTGACKALGKIIPQVKDKMAGLAFRVPIVNVSVLDLTIRLEMNTTLQVIFKQVEEASKTSLRNIIRLSNENAVSSDFMGDHHSCIVDVNSTLQLKPNFFKIICWYENEFSYACRVLDTIFLSEKQFSKLSLLSVKTTSGQSAQENSKENRQAELSNISVTTRNSNIEDRKRLCNSGGITTNLNFQPSGFKALLHRPSTNSHTSNSRDKFKSERIQNYISDRPKSAVSQNIGSFFHSCTTFAPKVNKKSEYPLDRLENVEKDFLGVVNITEKLKKSCKTPQEITRLDVAHGCSEEKASPKETKPAYKRVNNNQQTPFNVSGNIISAKSKPSNWDTCKELGFLNKLEIKKSSSDYNIKGEMKKIDTCESYIVELKTSKKNTCLLENTSNLKEKIVKKNVVVENSKDITSRKALFRELHLKYREQLNKINKTRSSTLANKKISLPKKKTLFEHVTIGELKRTTNEGNVEVGESKIKPSSATKNIQQNNAANTDHTATYRVKDLTKYLSTKNHNMQIMDKELKKRNIVLVNDNQNHDVAKKIAVDEQKFSDKILSGSNKWTTISNNFPVISCGSLTNTVTTISNGDAKRTESDLYDKLDSTSATNSDQSFDINEKKSQIINISDLSNSLEDLARLDKICRIIEISDELSDKLFSSLNKTDIKSLGKTQWSFRDLCKRIKLDEFCNQVFGKTGV